MELTQNKTLLMEQPEADQPNQVTAEVPISDANASSKPTPASKSSPVSPMKTSGSRTEPPRADFKKPHELPADYFDDFVEDLDDPECVQKIYDFSLTQVRGMVDYNDEDDVIQEVFYRLTKWPIGKKYNSAKHYFSLLKITIRQAIAAYWKRRHSKRNDVRKRVFISELLQDSSTHFEFSSDNDSNELNRFHIKELVRMVVRHVETLPANQRMMFELRFIQEKSHEEVAEAMSISIRTSYRLESKVRELLQARFVGESDVAFVWTV